MDPPVREILLALQTILIVMRMKINLITGQKSGFGGISRYCQELLNGLQQQHSVSLCTFNYPRLANRFSTLEHLPLGVKGALDGGVFHFTRIMGCSLMLWHPVRPAVATVHDLGPLIWPPEYKSRNQLDRLMLKLSLRGLKKMDWIIADSGATAYDVVNRLGFPKEHVSVVHLGVDHDRFHPLSNARSKLTEKYRLHFDPEVFYILYVGSEAPRKDLGTLLKAIAHLKSMGQQVQLIKVGASGGTKYRTAFEEQIREYHLSDSIVLFNSIPDVGLPVFYNAADVFVLPSLVEGFGLPVLEAMACGTPVICTDSGSLLEVVEDATLLFPPSDWRQLALTLNQVRDSKALRGKLKIGGQKQSNQFNWSKVVGETLKVYSVMCSRT